MEDKTLLEILKDCDAETFVEIVFKKYHYLCLSGFTDNGNEKSWKRYCLTPEHRTQEGCYKCRAEFLNMTLKEIEKEKEIVNEK